MGAGPSGLTFAHTLLDQGVPREQILVLESEAVAGGLCRSEEVDGAPLDIGGGHFLDVRNEKVLNFLFRFLPAEEWKRYDRVAKILLRGQEIDHPLEANLWQFAIADQVDYLESIAQTGTVRGEPMPKMFVEWVRWKLGERIAQDYMLPYNRKIWSMDLNLLGTYWLYKLPDVSFRDTLRSCLEGRAYGALPAHGTFLYPKQYGYGEVWRRMGEALGDRLLVNTPVKKIDIEKRLVNDQWQAEYIINSIPWTAWAKAAQGLPPEIVACMDKLCNVAIDVEYQEETLQTEAHWIYEPREELPHHRMLVRSNFCEGARGYWTEANAKRSQPTQGFRYHNEYAYPVNTLGKPGVVEQILGWAADRKILGLGRWGTWEHMNSDVAVATALEAGCNILQKG
ncbi:MAG: FAD-dependent oxidoreductase [Verrucomicrobiota bacterium]